MFNNGKIGFIPNPPQCQIGMVIDVTYNKRKFIFFAALALIVLLCTTFLDLGAYDKPAGYIQIDYIENGQTKAYFELTYNRFERVIFTRPLNVFAATTLAGLKLKHKPVAQAYQIVIAALSGSGARGSQNHVVVRIAQDDLENAKKIEESLISLANTIQEEYKRNTGFDLYTIELYRKALQEAGVLEFSATERRSHREQWQDDDDDDDDDDDNDD